MIGKMITGEDGAIGRTWVEAGGERSVDIVEELVWCEYTCISDTGDTNTTLKDV